MDHLVAIGKKGQIMHSISGSFVRAWRWFDRLVSILIAIVLIEVIALWIVGSVHAGHVMDTDELDRFSSQALQWLIAHGQ